ncbi:Pkinase domain-containing protein/LRR_1 domain-containing protein/LRR_6 domain-containing protein/LRR_8 domain-containing protein [Cephalotus follicularis]|uniref:Pkinase domain-containing protein/LRR_1 domain-containing protein/LRR_6 domain-containing protein/LRR_8 domain-containing protein n=1 Tax=Cephalotus follicularis TaxID=3775 RepID=A0A1Q3BCF3_CEPFO|nr:Pkinase domain-containing protein/LRR_1 domain-containing protein/LRR_6 domain-containing protein/LRR_8 domain-containing protein [Cephalotus follicularis]
MYQSQFNGTFPKEIGNLSNLEYLALAYNGFVPMSIPKEFGQLKKLRYLWMKGANLIGEIPDEFNSLSSLGHLDLSMNNLKGPIPSKLLSFENLTNLYLFHNELSGEIPKSVQALNLVNLDLSMNNLTGSIPEEFGNLKNLKLLNIFTNQLSGEVPSSIGLIPNLTDFRVFYNKLNGSLPPEMGLNQKLEAFEVSDNRFSGQLPGNLCAGGVLQGVVAFSNNLSGQVPKSLGNCRTLRTVQLYNNKFSGEIPSGLWTTFNLSSLMLSDNSFSGELPSELAWNLSRLEISNNRFSGQIPVGIGSWASLSVFEASDNLFSGKIPVEMTGLSHLNTLLLDGNQLSGELPSEILSWMSLTTLNLSRNGFSGQIPAVFGSLPDLLYLDLSENQLSGEIPTEVGNLRLAALNLSSNKLSGQIPVAFNNLAYEDSFLNNSHLCANNPVLNLPPCYTKLGPKKISSKFFAIIPALLVTVLIVTVLFTLFLIRDYRRKKHGHDLAKWKLTSFHILDFNESNILSNLTETNLIGSGGSGKVYRITVNNKDGFVAVKMIWNNRKLDCNLEKEFIAEVEILGTIRHSNIVKLLCCVSSEDSKLLVYEYMENQSLDRWLHGRKRVSMSGSSSVHHVVLDWPRRLQIAIGAAQGLCYMHHDCSPQILHRDVKSSNILLDSEFKAKIADFGLAKILGPKDGDGEQHTMSAVAGSFGYIAPEYAYTTKVNEKTDVYSFGVVLLELVTGREPNGGGEHTNLAEWAWQHYGEEKPILDALDPEIKEPCYLEDMTTVFKLGLMCTNILPSSRPSMRAILQILPQYPEGYGEKKTSEFDVAPLLGPASQFSIYKGSKNSDGIGG